MYSTYILPNGLKIITEKIDYFKSITIGVMIQNGSRNETVENNGISHFIEHMLFTGTEKRSSKKIREDIENLGGEINAFTNEESTCFYLKILSEHTETAIDVLSDMIINSKFSEEEIEKEKKVVVEEIKMYNDQPVATLYNDFSKQAYGSDPVSFPTLGTKELIKSFKREQIIKFVKEKYNPYNAVISICGNFDEKELIKMITEYFGKWSGDKFTPQYKKIELQKGSIMSVKQNVDQLQICLGLNGVEYGNNVGFTLELLDKIFGADSSSILFQKIREEMGLCYTIQSYRENFVGFGVYNIIAFLNKKYYKEALSSIVSLIKKFTNESISNKDIEIGRNKLKCSRILSLENPTNLMFKNAYSYLFLNKVKTNEDILNIINSINRDSIHDILSSTFEKGIISAAYLANNDCKKECDEIIFGK